MFVSVLNKAAGFFSQFFFTVNHYIYCMKNKINFKLKCDEWTFLYESGWTDYFMPIELQFENESEINAEQGHGYVIENVELREYQQVLPSIYRYNDFIQSKINERMAELGLKDKSYSSISIRRGDKLLCENIVIETDKYIERLLKEEPHCTIIFVHTDDYNCYLDLVSYIKTHDLSIRAITLCSDTLFGFTVGKEEFYNTDSNFSENNPYIHKIRAMNIKNKPVFAMNKEEIREHMITFLIELDIVLHSKKCVTDYSSNVRRFIKLWNYDSVIHVFDDEMDLNSLKCPAY